MKFEIKNRWTGDIIISVEAGSFKLAVEMAVCGNTNLSCADLSRANLSGAYLTGANLSGAHLSGAYLTRANLTGADLTRANISGAYLSCADLSRANLSCANLSRANLFGANLFGAHLSGANLSGADGINKHLCTPLTILSDQPGKIRAYKLVTKEGLGPYYPEINYLKGEEFAVDNYDESDAHCAPGISLATLDWCIKEWRGGYRILVMEFTAEDIASIPIGTDGKFRVKRCKRVGEKDLKELGLITEV